MISITGFPRWLQGLNINQVPAGLICTRSRSEGEKCLSRCSLSPRHADWQLEFPNGSKFPGIEFGAQQRKKNHSEANAESVLQPSRQAYKKRTRGEALS